VVAIVRLQAFTEPAASGVRSISGYA